MASILGDAKLEALIDGLQAQSLAQEADTRAYFQSHADAGRKDWWMSAGDHAHYADKLVALEEPKAEFCYGLCRAIGARRIVELGTSFGVSTLYLAAAVRDNCRDGGQGVVIGTEHERAKAIAARANFAAAGLERWIELREGDLRQTLKTLAGPIDFVLFDIWTPMVRPALERIGRIAEGWVTSSRTDLSRVGDLISVVKESAAAAGRDPEAMRFICRGVVRAGAPVIGPDGERLLLSGDYDQIRADSEWLGGKGVTEVFYDLNWDPQIGSPDVPGESAAARAEEILHALAPR